MPRSPRTGAKALQLLGRWNHLSLAHLPLGAGCSCGAPAVDVRVADLERDLLGFLSARHETAAARSVAELLRTIAGQASAAHDPLLADLERSLDSFDELHG